MGIQFTNNAYSTLASNINNSTTTIVLETGTGSRFPSLAAGDHFYVTIADNSGNSEIVKVTARSTDTLTVVRAQDSTTAKSFVATNRVELRPIAQAMRDVRDEAESTALALAIALG